VLLFEKNVQSPPLEHPTSLSLGSTTTTSIGWSFQINEVWAVVDPSSRLGGIPNGCLVYQTMWGIPMGA
jgi:hypothetical protein